MQIANATARMAAEATATEAAQRVQNSHLDPALSNQPQHNASSSGGTADDDGDEVKVDPALGPYHVSNLRTEVGVSGHTSINATTTDAAETSPSRPPQQQHPHHPFHPEVDIGHDSASPHGTSNRADLQKTAQAASQAVRSNENEAKSRIIHHDDNDTMDLDDPVSVSITNPHDGPEMRNNSLDSNDHHSTHHNPSPSGSGNDYRSDYLDYDDAKPTDLGEENAATGDRATDGTADGNADPSPSTNLFGVAMTPQELEKLKDVAASVAREASRVLTSGGAQD